MYRPSLAVSQREDLLRILPTSDTVDEIDLYHAFLQLEWANETEYVLAACANTVHNKYFPQNGMMRSLFATWEIVKRDAESIQWSMVVNDYLTYLNAPSCPITNMMVSARFFQHHIDHPAFLHRTSDWKDTVIMAMKTEEEYAEEQKIIGLNAPEGDTREQDLYNAADTLQHTIQNLRLLSIFD